MLLTTNRSWWVVLLRGIAALIFGILALVFPGSAVQAIAWVFGAYALVDGIFALVAAFGLSNHDDRWWTLIAAGVIGSIAGIIALFMTGAALVFVIYVVASWAILTGIFELVAAFRLRRILSQELFLLASGLISLVLGILLFAWPSAGIVIASLMIGWYAILYGCSLIGLSFRLRKHHTDSIRIVGEKPA